MAPVSRGATDRALAWRVALRLAPAALLVTAAAGWILVAGVERTLESRASARLQRITETSAARMSETAQGVLRGLEQLGLQLKHEEAGRLEGLLLGRPEDIDTAERLRHRAGLDTLELLDESGSILSSSRSGRIGLRDRSLLSREPQSVALEQLETSGGVRWAFRAVHRLDVGRRALFLAASRFVDDAVMERIGGGEAAWLLIDGVQARSAAAAASGIHSDDLGSVAAGRAGAVRGAAASWSAAARKVPGAGGRAQLLLALDRQPDEALQRRMRLLYVLLVLAAGIVAGSSAIWIARSITDPVDRLVRAVDSIASGEADYTFPATERDTFDRLTRSFSNLQRSLERQRQRSLAAERVAAWRDVARHVAHEVKNPLAPIRLTVENLQRARERAPERFETMFREGTATILEEVEQLSRLVGEFSEFARLPQPEPRTQPLEPILDRAVDLFAPAAGLQVERKIPAGLPPVCVDADQMLRAFKNIIANAVDAMPDGERWLGLTAAVEEDFVRVEIADRGRGFAEGQERRIFEPYFTTKQAGTGLGMAITYRIVTEHDGWITAENRPSGGARIVVRLPLAAGRKERG